jgi:ABC-type bacteriocin/lantibiotic exporter with double-glycine peptidase domain
MLVEPGHSDRSYIVDKLLRLPLDFFENNPTGQTLNKLHNIWQIRHFLTGQLFGTFLDAVPLLGLVPVMLILEWHLALIAFGLAALIFVVVMLYLPPLARAHRRVVVAVHHRHHRLLRLHQRNETLSASGGILVHLCAAAGRSGIADFTVDARLSGHDLQRRYRSQSPLRRAR